MIGKSSFASLGALSLIDTLITDSYILDVDRDHFTGQGIKLIISPEKQ